MVKPNGTHAGKRRAIGGPRQGDKVKQGHVILKVQEKRTPIHGRFVGFRILVAVPNMAGYSLLRRRPSPAFRKPYLIEESSDYDPGELLAKLAAKVRELRERGFIMEEALAYEERMSELGDPSRFNPHAKTQQEAEAVKLRELKKGSHS